MKFNIVYEPKIEDPVVVAQFKIQSEAESFMKDLKINRPKTYKYTSIVVEKN